MELYYYTITTLFIIILTTFSFTKLLTKPNPNKQPPGPKPWPIIGNIHQLGDKPHHSITELSKTYGRIMSLKLGNINTIVISSPKIAQEMFLKHDLALSGRNITEAIKVANHHEYSIVFLPVCDRWRTLKKIITTQLFTHQRLEATLGLRRLKVNELVKYIQKCCETSVPVDIGKVVFTTSLNLLSNTLFSMDLASYENPSSQDFKDLIWNILEEGGRPNVSDFFPLVRGLDLQGVVKRTIGYSNKILGVFQGIIDERMRNCMDGKEDVLATLLKLVEDKELSLDQIKHLLVDLFVAGTDTTSTTIEWAMTELLQNPAKITKAQLEINKSIGKDMFIPESDSSSLPYIEAIVKETYRLHSPVPFLIPHKAEKDVNLGGYFVSKNSQIWVNIWSIGRDPSIWPNPLSFLPERFLDKEVDVKGQYFELIPFGAGRRVCPGMPLGLRMGQLVLATLIHSFDWKYHDEATTKDINMEEKFGITLQKAQPLLAIPFRRQPVHPNS